MPSSVNTQLEVDFHENLWELWGLGGGKNWTVTTEIIDTRSKTRPLKVTGAIFNLHLPALSTSSPSIRNISAEGRVREKTSLHVISSTGLPFEAWVGMEELLNRPLTYLFIIKSKVKQKSHV